MNYRKYSCSVALVLVLFVLFHFVVWKTCTEKLFVGGGHLARLGYLPSFRMEREESYDLPHRHISLREYHGQPVDVLTLGDSFTNGGAGGKNRYYQDYIASYNRMSVLNVGLYKREGFPPFFGPLQTLLLLANSGELDRLAPRSVVVSISVKQAVMFLGDPLDLGMSVAPEKVKDTRNYEWYGDSAGPPPEKQSFISTANLNFIYYAGLRHFRHKTPKAVALAHLRKKLFSVEGDELLYFSADVDRISGENRKNLEQINSNLNQIAGLLAKKGIKLYFMPCVDKYDLYSPYIVNNKQPKSEFFEIFRQLPKQYSFIDTKQILSGMLEEGVTDVFYSDDTHWSWKASQRIFETVRFR